MLWKMELFSEIPENVSNNQLKVTVTLMLLDPEVIVKSNDIEDCLRLGKTDKKVKENYH